LDVGAVAAELLRHGGREELRLPHRLDGFLRESCFGIDIRRVLLRDLGRNRTRTLHEVTVCAE